MKINLTGTTRIVIELKNSVIKIPNFTCQWSHFLSGLLANMRESGSYYYRKKHGEDSSFLCPIKWASWGGWILVMQKAEILTREEYDKIDLTVWDKLGFEGDHKQLNYGKINGVVVKIDYA